MYQHDPNRSFSLSVFLFICGLSWINLLACLSVAFLDESIFKNDHFKGTYICVENKKVSISKN